MDKFQDVLYSNRALCYLQLKDYYRAELDLNKAISTNPYNIKALKRLANLNIQQGKLSEARVYLQSCINIEKDVKAHEQDVEFLNDLIRKFSELKKEYFLPNFEKTEALANELIRECTDFTYIKLIYIE